MILRRYLNDTRGDQGVRGAGGGGGDQEVMNGRETPNDRLAENNESYEV